MPPQPHSALTLTLTHNTHTPPAAADFRLDFYTEVQDLAHLVAAMAPGPFSERYRKLSAGLADVVQEYGLLAFTPLAIQVGLGAAGGGLWAEACFRAVSGLW